MLASRRSGGAGVAAVVAVVLLGVLGCGDPGLKTYPVRGNVELAGGDVKVLAGSHVEAALVRDNTTRASGEIQPDGTFALQTQHQGVLLKGAPEGQYEARIILTDDDRKARKQAAQAVHARFLRFNTSGLTFQVPTNGDVTLKVSRR